MNRVIYNLRTLALAAMIAACVAQTPSSRNAEPQDILNSVTPEQRELWQAAIDGGALPPISAIEVAADPVENLPVRLVAADEQPTPPTLPENVATGAIAITVPTTRRFLGRAEVVERTSERLLLRLETGQPLEIAYRSPSREALAGLDIGSAARVEIASPEPIGPGEQTDIAIGREQGGVALAVVRLSDLRPIDRKYELDRMRIRQVLNTAELRRLARAPVEMQTEGVPLPVEVAIGDRRALVQPGEIAGPDKTGLPYEIVVFHSWMYPPDEINHDTPPFSLNVAIFAIDLR